MLTQIMKCLAAVALIVAVFSWHASADIRVAVQFVVCVGAGLVFVQAISEKKRLWAAGFFGVVILFNPVAPFALSRGIFLWLDAVCLAMFLSSLAFLRSSPRLSVASITDPGPGNESL